MKGGYYINELKYDLVKESINNGNNLKINNEVYNTINKIHNVAYKINKKFLKIIIENKKFIFKILLSKFEENSLN